MNVPFVHIKKQTEEIRSQVDAAITEVLDNAYFVDSPVITSFEESFAQYQGSKYCIGCANGTDALEIALELLNVGQGDEVLVPSHTWISTASSVYRAGATPVFVDCLSRNYTMDTAKIESAISSKTKAIIPVHLTGCPVDMDTLMSIANKNNLKVIEDCAQSHGAEWKGTQVGNFGDIATFSFYPSKNVGTFGHSGALTLNNDDMYARGQHIVNHGQSTKNIHQLVGRNSKMDTIQAAILKIILTKIDDWNNNRIKNAAIYQELLGDLPGIELPICPEGSKHVYHLYVTQVDNRDKVREELEKRGIATQIHYPNMLSQMDVFKDESKTQKFDISHNYNERIMSLPFSPFISREEMEYVAEALKKILA
jgi:dTDP-4-amino-4,6-dideoxygalactose transaminase